MYLYLNKLRDLWGFKKVFGRVSIYFIKILPIFPKNFIWLKIIIYRKTYYCVRLYREIMLPCLKLYNLHAYILVISVSCTIDDNVAALYAAVSAPPIIWHSMLLPRSLSNARLRAYVEISHRHINIINSLAWDTHTVRVRVRGTNTRFVAVVVVSRPRELFPVGVCISSRVLLYSVIAPAEARPSGRPAEKIVVVVVEYAARAARRTATRARAKNLNQIAKHSHTHK